MLLHGSVSASGVVHASASAEPLETVSHERLAFQMTDTLEARCIASAQDGWASVGPVEGATLKVTRDRDVVTFSWEMTRDGKRYGADCIITPDARTPYEATAHDIGARAARTTKAIAECLAAGLVVHEDYHL
jgi:hypothetical protein